MPKSKSGKIPQIDLIESSDPSDELMKRGIYYVMDEIDSSTIMTIHQDIILKHLDPKWRDDIQIIINSYGGTVDAGWALIDLLNWVKMDVKTVGLGVCASTAACLVACGTHGKRVISQNTTMLIHGASREAEGNIHQYVSVMKDMKDEHMRDVKFWLKHSRYETQAAVEERFLTGFDVYLTAEEALRHGIVDAVV